MKNMPETIAAIATPPGQGGVGIVRISGPEAYTIACRLTRSQILKPRFAIFKSFYLEENLLDQGIVLYFKAPHSFTGEDVIELQAHGSPIVLNNILNACVMLGARLSRPGEFSERAFLNDKIDLTQAEAIADLIAATSDTAAKFALRSLQGDFSKKINELNQEIIYLRMYVEAAIDFPEEEINFLSDGKVANMLQAIKNNLETIRKNAFQGTLLREGAVVVIAGAPNAGKSTLINALSGNDVAIVTAVAGTTRDVMKEHILIDHLPIQIVDTAGLRETEDVVEQEGIKRAWQALENADCVLLVSDVQEQEQAILSAQIKEKLPKAIPLVRVINKIDTLNQTARREGHCIYLSAKAGDGLTLLKDSIKTLLGFRPQEGIFMARQRHMDALDKAYQFILSGHQALHVHEAGELLAEDLHHAHLALCLITGEFTTDDLLGKIFSSFCIGK